MIRLLLAIWQKLVDWLSPGRSRPPGKTASATGSGPEADGVEPAASVDPRSGTRTRRPRTRLGDAEPYRKPPLSVNRPETAGSSKIPAGTPLFDLFVRDPWTVYFRLTPDIPAAPGSYWMVVEAGTDGEFWTELYREPVEVGVSGIYLRVPRQDCLLRVVILRHGAGRNETAAMSRIVRIPRAAPGLEPMSYGSAGARSGARPGLRMIEVPLPDETSRVSSAELLKRRRTHRIEAGDLPLSGLSGRRSGSRTS